MSEHANKCPAPAEATENPQCRDRTLAGRGWRRLFFAGAAGITLFFAFMFGLGLYRAHIADKDLQDAIAEADRLDPGWRLEELEAKRDIVPAKENSEVYVNKAGRTGITVLNAGTNRQDLIDAVAGTDLAMKNQLTLSPKARLSKQQTEALRAALAPLAAPLADASMVADLPNGRHPFNTSPGLNYGLRHVDHAGIAVWLLGSEALLQIQDGNADDAWLCCRAILNSARSFGDEPEMMAQGVRTHYGAEAARFMERVLAQSQVPDGELAATILLLQEEIKHPATLISLRARRAYWHHIMTQVEAGKISPVELKAAAGDRWSGALESNYYEVQGYFRSHEIKPAHAWLLRYLTQAVEIAKRAGNDTDSALLKLQITLADAPPLARQWAPNFDWCARRTQHRAVCACACAGLAAERFRLEHDRWPAALADLVAARLLDEVPADPYDGKPLRLRRANDGIVIYSIGPNGDGKGNALDANPRNVNDYRLEFRLWDREKR